MCCARSPYTASRPRHPRLERIGFILLLKYLRRKFRTVLPITPHQSAASLVPSILFAWRTKQPINPRHFSAAASGAFFRLASPVLFAEIDAVLTRISHRYHLRPSSHHNAGKIQTPLHHHQHFCKARCADTVSKCGRVFLQQRPTAHAPPAQRRRWGCC